MARMTDAELGRLVRQALKGKRLKPRRLDGATVGDILAKALSGKPTPRGTPGQRYLESDRDFLENNNDAAVAILEALAPSKRKAD